MERCENCGDYYYASSCGCKPFKCSHDNGEYDGGVVYADSHEQAAEKHARDYNENGDYPMMDGGEDTIEVTVTGDGSTMKFKVTAEADIAYYANQVTDTA